MLKLHRVLLNGAARKLVKYSKMALREGLGDRLENFHSSGTRKLIEAANSNNQV